MDRETDIYRHLRFMVILTIIAIAILIGLLAYWSFYPYDPISTSPKPYKIVFPQDKIVRQGGYLTYQFDYNKTSKVLPIIRRQFVDGIVFNVAGSSSPTVTDVGKGTARVQIKIPETLPPGSYYLHIIAEYEMNPIRTIFYESSTEEFEVVSGFDSNAQKEALDRNDKER